jgi:hypothetical protein
MHACVCTQAKPTQTGSSSPQTLHVDNILLYGCVMALSTAPFCLALPLAWPACRVSVSD